MDLQHGLLAYLKLNNTMQIYKNTRKGREHYTKKDDGRCNVSMAPFLKKDLKKLAMILIHLFSGSIILTVKLIPHRTISVQ